MSYTALYRKYRPSNFESVVGQGTIVDILKNSILSHHISHAYLFTGPRGTGKTSIAKIFAHAVNCENFIDDICGECDICKNLQTNDIDIIEIDAASNNGVEEIRTLRDNVKLLPSFCKYKIYIIDEVHMLSTGAFNALLKTLEEPPAHVIFILATTEPNKIPLTILSRCQRYDFNKIDKDSIINRLEYILKCESLSLSTDVLNYIAEVSDGGLRDAINLLDQTISLSSDEITVKDVEKICGKVSINLIVELLDYIVKADYRLLLDFIDRIMLDGKNYVDIVNNMLIFLRDYIVNMQVSNYFEENYIKLLSKYTFSSSQVLEITNCLNDLLFQMKNSNDQKLLFEIHIMNLIQVINTKNHSDDSYKHDEAELTNSNSMELQVTDQNVVEEGINNNDSIIIQPDESNTEELIENCEENSNNDDKLNLDSLKKIRINNVFAEANKDILKEVLSDYDRINDFISNKIYNIVSALLIDGKVVVASSEYLLFSFKDESFVSVFDGNYKQIELFLNEIYDKSFKVVAVTDNEWEKLKQDFILNKKNNIPYVKISENDVQLNKSEEFSELENSALNIFGEDAISVR